MKPTNSDGAWIVSFAHLTFAFVVIEFLVERNAADGITSIIFKDRRPGGAGIDSFPYTAGPYRYIHNILIVRMNGDVCDTSRCHGRADITQFQSIKGLLTFKRVSFFS